MSNVFLARTKSLLFIGDIFSFVLTTYGQISTYPQRKKLLRDYKFTLNRRQVIPIKICKNQDPPLKAVHDRLMGSGLTIHSFGMDCSIIMAM